MPVGVKSRENCRGCRGYEPPWNHIIGEFERSQKAHKAPSKPATQHKQAPLEPEKLTREQILAQAHALFGGHGRVK